MNVLAREHLALFDNDVSLDEQKQRRQEFYNRYARLRDKTEKGLWGKMTLAQTEPIHPFMYFVFKLNLMVNGLKARILEDHRTEITEPTVFAVTHISKFDIEIIGGMMKEHMYLLTGDYERIQGTANEALLALNGVFYVNEDDVKDRKLVKEKMIAHLLAGGNIMYFPEGTWNLTDNLPVMKCFWGIIEVALRGNANIVPIAIERYGKRFDIIIGEQFDLSKYDDTCEGKTAAITCLRDTLATLKWKIWERRPVAHRECIDKKEWQKLVQDWLSEWPHYDIRCNMNMRYKPRNTVDKQAVFNHLSEIEVNASNAFLWNKENH